VQCIGRGLLLAIYRDRVRDYSQAVATLGTHRPSLSLDDFMKYWHCAEFARDACTLARINVWSHLADHRCLDEGDPLTDRIAA